MGRVRVLPESIANSIAAGEVVERPASIVKELVENSLDAGATRITIEVQAGGKREIKVIDNGCGMDATDALLAFERHATSKISSKHDLNRIATMGFRGEALPCIAAVSRLRLIASADESQPATRVVIDGGVMKSVQEVGAPTGTTIEVRDLFFNIPARRKFLRTTGTEFSHILNIVSQIALANPSCAIQLTHNGKSFLRAPAFKDPKQRLHAILGHKFAGSVIPCDYPGPPRVHGFVGVPSITNTTRESQYLFVNRRPIRDRSLNYAVSQAYRRLVPDGRHPFLILFIEIDLELVDVNVHPAKTEVRFAELRRVQGAVIQAITATLEHGKRPFTASQEELPVTRDEETSDEGRESVAPEENNREYERVEFAQAFPPDSESSAVPSESQVAAPSDERAGGLKHTIPPELTGAERDTEGRFAPNSTAAFERESAVDNGREQRETRKPEVAAGLTYSLEEAHLIGQMANTYILLDTKEALLMIDQHAAHERVLYDQFRKSLDDGEIAIQHRVVPAMLELTPQQEVQLEIYGEELVGLGFQIEDFGNGTYVIKSAPALIGTVDPGPILLEALGELSEKGRANAVRSFHEAFLISLSCKSAIKAGDPLEPDEMRKLVQKLTAASMPYTCPHGRPTLVEFPISGIERSFGRR